jgi:hypothetical protein
MTVSMIHLLVFWYFVEVVSPVDKQYLCQQSALVFVFSELPVAFVAVIVVALFVFPCLKIKKISLDFIS